MKSASVFNLRMGGANSRVMWGNILFTLSLFLILLFLTEIPQDIQAGRKGQIALLELDSMHEPLIEIRALASSYNRYDNFSGINSDLVKLQQGAESCIHNYELAADYNSELRKNVGDFTAAFQSWVFAEREFLKLYFDNSRSQADYNRARTLALQGHENNSLFLSVLQLLTDGELPIHHDMAKGHQAFTKLQWSSLLFIAYIFTVIFYFQRKSNREHVIREKNLEMTLMSIGDAVIATDIHGCITSMNPVAEHLTGWQFNDANGHALSDVFKVVDAHSGMPVNDMVERVQQERGIVVLAEDSMLIAASGNRYQIYENGAPIYDDAGEIIGVVLVFRDITQEHVLKKCLNEHALRLQRVIDSSMDAVIVADEQGRISEWNPAAEKMFGWSYAEVRKQPIHELIVPEEFRERHLQGIQRLIEEDSTTFRAKRIESQALHRYGHIFPIELAMTSLQTENGWVFNAYISDLTERNNDEDLIKKNNILLNEAERIAKVGSWEFDLVNNKLHWSDELCSIYCVDPSDQEATYDKFSRCIHPDDKARVEEAFKKCIKEHKLIDISHRIVTPDGIKFIHGKGETSYDQDGRPLRALGVALDVTEQIQKENLIDKHNKILHETQRIAKLGYWELDLENGKLEWSDEIFRIFDLDPATTEPSYGLFINTIHPEDRERVDSAYSESLKNKLPYNVIHRIVTSKGVRVVHEQCNTTFADDGKALRSLGLIQDITERVSDMDELRLAATMFRTHAGILITDKNGIIVRVNPAFEEMTGYSSKELVGRNPRILQSGKHDKEFYQLMWEQLKTAEMWQGELWNKRKDGTLYAEWLTITSVKDDLGEVGHYVGTSQDITERKHAETQLEYLAYHDGLTDLANRRLLMDRLQQNIVSCKRNDEFGAVLILDLDYFKDLNDSLGHAVGDDVLRGVASRLKEIVREGDTVARLGGDEFVVVLSSVGKDESRTGVDVQVIAEKIRSSISKPYKLKEGQYVINASIGITLFPENSDDIADILKHADTALYRAKEQGRNTVCFYKPEMQAEVDERLAIAEGLRNAIENNEFVLHYQPQVNSRGELLGAEALIRWLHPEQGMILPNKFISVAEDTGLILDIGRWVLQEATRQVVEWHSTGICSSQSIRMSVNVSPRQFSQKDFVAQTINAFKDAGVSPECISLEVTESMVMHDLDEVVEKMQQLRAQGIRISIDDFGTGYSSLAYLKKLPLDQLKIDQSFICDITNDDSDVVVVDTIIAMARHLGLSVIAEGVENQAQVDILIEKGCNAFQGHYFYRPLNAEDFAAFIKQQSEPYLSSQA